MLVEVYHEINWNLFTCRMAVPQQVLNLFEIKRKFLDTISNELQIKTQQDWKKINTKESFKEFHENRLINWDESGKITVSQIKQKFIDKIAKQYQIKTQQDWKKIGLEKIRKSNRNLLNKYNENLFSILFEVYPEINWNELRFRRIFPRYFWNSLENRRSFLDSVSYRLQIKTQRDWKKIAYKEMKEWQISLLTQSYRNNIFSMLVDVYPEINWDILKCRSRIPQHFWKSLQNKKKFLNDLANSYNIRDKEDLEKIVNTSN